MTIEQELIRLRNKLEDSERVNARLEGRVHDLTSSVVSLTLAVQELNQTIVNELKKGDGP